MRTGRRPVSAGSASFDQPAVEIRLQMVVLPLAVMGRDARPGLRLGEQPRQVDALRLVVLDRAAPVEMLGLADHVREAAETEQRHQLAHLLGDEEEIVDHVLRRAGEPLAQLRILGGDPDRAGVEMALAHHDAARGDQRRGREAELVRAEQRAHHDVAPGAEAAIDLDRDAAAQPVEHQRLVGLGEPDLPRRAGMGDRGQRAGAGAAFEARDGHVVGARLGDPRRHRSHPDLGDQLHRDVGVRVGVLQVVDQLGEVLDRVDVVMRRRRDQPHAGRRVPHLGDHRVHLVPRQLAALAGLGALGHLDLHHVGIDEVFGGHAEAARGHLLDRRAHGIAVGHGPEAVRLLAALAGIRLAADPVHRHREGRMRLARDRTEGHRPGREPLDDPGRRLDLVERHRRLRRDQLEQAPDGHHPMVLVVHQPGEVAIFPGQRAAHRVLQMGDGVGRPVMLLAAQAVGVLAAGIERVAVDRRVAIGEPVAFDGLPRDLRQPRPADGARGAGEEPLDEALVQADGVEDLRAAIGLVGRDAHLGHHLEDALVDRLDVAPVELAVAQPFRQLVPHRRQRLEREIGVDRLGAVTGQGAEVMDFARLAGLDDQPEQGAEPRPHEVVVHRRGAQQRRDGDAVVVDRAVAEHQDVVALLAGPLGLGADRLERRAHPFRAVRRGIGQVQGDGPERVVGDLADRADLLEILVGQHRLAHFETPLRRRVVDAQQVGARADEGQQRHHQLLADRVDRRVGDLGEDLLEIRIQQLGARRQRRNRGVGAHRADGFLSGQGHRRHQELEVLLGVAEGLLAVEQRQPVGLRGGGGPRRQVLQHDLGAVEPLLIGPDRGQAGLDVVVVDDAAPLEVDQQHLAGLQAPLPDDATLVDRQDADLGAHHHQVVVGDDVARGTQPVAVEGRADLAAVGEGDGGRAVPRLHQRRVVLVEGAALLVHQRIAGPRLRDQHHHRMGQRIARPHQQLQRVVEARRIRLALGDQRPQLFQVVAEQLALHQMPARRHPVDVSAQRVDLAVVADHPVGVGEPPRGEGVGGKPLVDEGERGDHRLVREVEIVLAHLVRQQHPLVDDDARREGRRVEVVMGLAEGGDRGARSACG